MVFLIPWKQIHTCLSDCGHNQEMPAVNPTPKIRDAERSKTAILEAATQLFAAKGFEATSIAEIAEKAGVARGTPSYFFGNKDALQGAVVAGLNARALKIVPDALERAGENPSAARLLEVFIDGYLDFQHQNPEFLQVIHWLSRDVNPLLSLTHWNSLETMIGAVMLTFKNTPLEREDPRQVVLTLIGMCNAHLTYAHSLVGPLGFAGGTPEFLETRKAHLKRMMLGVLYGSSAS